MQGLLCDQGNTEDSGCAAARWIRDCSQDRLVENVGERGEENGRNGEADEEWHVHGACFYRRYQHDWSPSNPRYPPARRAKFRQYREPSDA